MQVRAGRETRACDVARVCGNFRLNEDYIKHNKKALRSGTDRSAFWFRRKLVCAGDRIDVHAATLAIETHGAVHERENCVIAPQANVFTRQKFRAALADDDVSGDDSLAAEFFYAESFADAVASILDAALTFFMCHVAKWVSGLTSVYLMLLILSCVILRRWPTVR